MTVRRFSEVDDFLLFAGSASKKLAVDCRISGARSEHRKRSGSPRAISSSGSWRTSEAGTCSWSRAPRFPRMTISWSCSSGSTRLKRASAASVTAVIPYFSYAKGDKKDEPRVSIRARVCADAIEAAGADRVVTLDLHAPQVQGFFRIPVDDLYALPVLCDAISAKGLENLVVVAPDAGFAKKARQWANRLGAPTAIADKRRADHSESAEIIELMGSVEGRTALDRGRLHDLGGNPRRCCAEFSSTVARHPSTPRSVTVCSQDAANARRRQPDRTPLHHRQRRDPTRTLSRPRSRSFRSPASSAKPSAASRAVRASRCSSNRTRYSP